MAAYRRVCEREQHPLWDLPRPSNWIWGGNPDRKRIQIKGREKDWGKRKVGRGGKRDKVPYGHFYFPLPAMANA